ncbi:MOSC domain-containing protein [Halobacteriales archaeon SW_8_65_20]|nr:MAG: MOSC domain-containing protein [Halobacteriales archaeon SW_8_65_20]
MAATLDSVHVYPVKSLDGIERDRTTVRESGGLAFDREYAVRDADGDYVNGKRERRVHRLASEFDPDSGRWTVGPRDGERETFRLPDERGAASEFLTDVFGYEVRIDRDATGGFPDDGRASGPTVVSRATLAAVAGWYDEIDATELRRRLRPNLVVGGVEPFWEDRLYADRESVVRFTVGGTRFEGRNPCKRCVVPTRDPDTGAETPGFRERFVSRRETTLPEWAGEDWYDHYFRLMVNTRVPRETVGARVAVGDEIEIGETVDVGE